MWAGGGSDVGGVEPGGGLRWVGLHEGGYG